ncbi:alpha/beta fold hydrolase [Nonomuraea terrae]|uniref:alpha/beta fold hydrolase n=1 Tax=Nonomuraea terrae TaxID=2530383 RepID=UPI0037B020FE
MRGEEPAHHLPVFSPSGDSQLQVPVHVELEASVQVQMRPEQGGQSPPIGRAQLLLPGGIKQHHLDQVRVEVGDGTASINWYRNVDRNWHLLAEVDPIIRQPALMIYGDRDVVSRVENLAEFVPNVEVVSLDCGHWIQQEKPEETNQAMVKWREQQDAT